MFKDDSLILGPKFHKIMVLLSFLLCGGSLFLLGLKLYELKAEPILETLMGAGVLSYILTAISTCLSGLVFLQRFKNNA